MGDGEHYQSNLHSYSKSQCCVSCFQLPWFVCGVCDKYRVWVGLLWWIVTYKAAFLKRRYFKNGRRNCHECLLLCVCLDLLFCVILCSTSWGGISQVVIDRRSIWGYILIISIFSYMFVCLFVYLLMYCLFVVMFVCCVCERNRKPLEAEFHKWPSSCRSSHRCRRRG